MIHSTYACVGTCSRWLCLHLKCCVEVVLQGKPGVGVHRIIVHVTPHYSSSLLCRHCCISVLSLLSTIRLVNACLWCKFIVSIAHLSSWQMVEHEEKHVMKDHTVKEALWQGLVNVQCSKLPEVVTTTAEVLDELGLKEEATQLRGWLESTCL